MKQQEQQWQVEAFWGGAYPISLIEKPRKRLRQIGSRLVTSARLLVRETKRELTWARTVS